MNKSTKVTEIFQQSLTIYQKRFWTFFLIVLIPFLFSKLISYFIPAESFKLVNYVLTSAITLWGTLSLYQTIQNKNTNLPKIFSQSFKNLVPFLIINLLNYLTIFGGLILFIIPGILFAIWFNLASWIFVDQDIRGNKALILSKKYMTGNIGYFFKKTTLIALLSIIPFIIIFYLFKENFILIWTLTGILSALIYPLNAIYSYFIYQNIKDSKSTKTKKIKD